jgi:hypothetical protein
MVTKKNSGKQANKKDAMIEQNKYNRGWSTSTTTVGLCCKYHNWIHHNHLASAALAVGSGLFFKLRVIYRFKSFNGNLISFLLCAGNYGIKSIVKNLTIAVFYESPGSHPSRDVGPGPGPGTLPLNIYTIEQHSSREREREVLCVCSVDLIRFSLIHKIYYSMSGCISRFQPYIFILTLLLTCACVFSSRVPSFFFSSSA